MECSTENAGLRKSLCGGGPVRIIYVDSQQMPENPTQKHPKTCSQCHRTYTSKQSISNNLKRCDKIGTIEYPRSCAKCNKLLLNRFNYSRHVNKCIRRAQEGATSVTEEHVCRVSDGAEMLHFLTYEEFLTWKEENQRENCTYYTKRCGDKIRGDVSYRYFDCIYNEKKEHTHRKSTEPLRKTSRKWAKGSVAQSQFCTAKIRVHEDDSGVNVMFWSKHNHKTSVKDFVHIPLSKDSKLYIQTSDLPPRDILKQLIGDAGDLDKREGFVYHQEHFLALSDVKRLKKSGIRKKSEMNDASSVAAMVNDYRLHYYNNPIIAYKPQGSDVVIGDHRINNLPFSRDLLVLGIQTKEQLEAM